MAPGRKATFKVEATGDCLKFKWQKDRKIDLSDDEKCYDTDTDTLHIGEVEKSDKGRYRCRVSNYITEIFSKEVVLTVSKLVIHACVLYALAVKPTPSFPMYGVGYEIYFNERYTLHLSVNSPLQITFLFSQSIHLSSLNTHTACL